MAGRSDAKDTSKTRTLVHIAILLATAMIIGVYLVGTTVVVSGDSVIYVRYTQVLLEKPADTLRRIPIHPGYPVLVLATERLLDILGFGRSFQNTVLAAQIASLLAWFAAIILLYIFGAMIVGPSMSFWAVLILIFLPYPTRYACDALADWPHMAFLAGGLVLLTAAVTSSKCRLFPFVGMISGIGYLIRPECGQLVLYSAAWLILGFLRPTGSLTRCKAVLSLALVLAGFACTAGPFMAYTGYLFPEHWIGRIPRILFAADSNTSCINTAPACFAAALPTRVIYGLQSLFKNLCETLMYVFIAPLLIGMHSRIHRKSEPAEAPEKFIIIIFITLNAAMLVALYSYSGYLSRRHSLPLASVLLFYVPLGLRILGSWLSTRFPQSFRGTPADRPRKWFLLLIIIALAVCAPKLLRPLHADKKHVREAAEWLNVNTEPGDRVDGPDVRIAFYAQRQYKRPTDSKEAEYLVKILQGDPESVLQEDKNLQAVHRLAVEAGRTLIIYRLAPDAAPPNSLRTPR